MSAYQVSITNRRFVLLAVMSLIASLFAVSSHAPAAQATNENFTFAAGTDIVAEGADSIDVDVTLTATEGALLQDTSIDVEVDPSSTATNGLDFSFTSPTTVSWLTSEAPSTKSVTITITDDDIDDDGETIVLNLVTPVPGTATTSGFSTITITITDNDTAGVTVAETGTTDVTEGGATDTYTVVLDSEPTADVTISFVVDQVSTDAGGSLLFTAADWDTVQTVTVSAANDDIDEASPHSGSITQTASSSDPLYNGISVADISVNVTDNDTRGVSVSPTTVDVIEGGADDTYDVVLLSEPTASVTITIDDGTSGEFTLDESLLTFTTGNWDSPQTVTATAVNDAVEDGDSSNVITHTSAGGDYAGEPVSDVTVNVTDNDTKGVSVTPTTLNTLEAGATSDSYDVVLLSEPTGTVTITIDDGGTTEFTLDKSSLTFTTGNWDSPQTVTATAVNDDVDDGNSSDVITHTISGGGYISEPVADVTVNVTDNDTVGVTVTETDGTTDISEDGAVDIYSVVLDSEPAATVTITVAVDDQVQTDSGGSLSFDATNWDTAQDVTVSAVDDAIHEADPHTGLVTQTAASTDLAYDGIAVANVTANITDNNPATVTFLNPTSNAQEDGGGHEITVRLAVPGGGALLAPLVVDVEQTGGTATGGGVDYNFATDTITFQTGWSNGWDQFTNIGIVDDGAQESPETIVFGLNVTSGGEVGIGNTTHTVTIVDDETRNFVVTPSGGNTVVAEANGTDTFDVHLTQAPTGTVTVTLAKTTLGDEFNLSTTTLTFTASNWMDDQTVTVTGVPDAYDDGDLAGVITLTASGGGYLGVVATESVTITDDDTAGVTITESGAGTAVTEGTGSDTYTVVLDARPTSNVTVSFNYDTAELSLDRTSLTFTTSNWSTAQTVTVSGVADGAAEPTETLTIQHSTASADPPFQGLAVASVDVMVTNSDQLQVSIEGPSFGVPGIGATFEAIQNASGTGDVVYLWQVLENNLLLPGVSGTASTFTFTPDDGGTYVIWAQISDDISSTAFFIDFTVMGDVAGSVFADQIIWLAEEGITKGCTQDGTSFCPNDFVTRGQMAAFLVRFLDLTDSGAGDLFEDDDNSIFEDNIDKLATAGITRGCNPPLNTDFCPLDRVTRGQMAAFLVRALSLTDNGAGDLFGDDDGLVFENNIDILATAGITKGCNPPANTNFCPHDFVTRGQMAAFLQRAAALLP